MEKLVSGVFLHTKKKKKSPPGPRVGFPNVGVCQSSQRMPVASKPLEAMRMSRNHLYSHTPLTNRFLLKPTVVDMFLLKSCSTVPCNRKAGQDKEDRSNNVIIMWLVIPPAFNGHRDQLQTQSRVPRPPTPHLSKAASHC